MRFFTSFIMTIFLKIGISILFLTATLQLYSDTIFVGGIMTENETWTRENTYVVFQDLIVQEGIALTIEEGVEIRVNYGRGITIDNGVLQVFGTQTDSVIFIPNHNNSGQIWKWKGIVILNCVAENEIYFSYAKIADAETAIKLEDSRNVIIENSSMMNCQNLGFQILNSNYCLLNNCYIKNNYDGVEIFGDYQGTSSNNIISSCIIENQNHNIYIYRNIGGACQNNLITKNLIRFGNNGIWFYNIGIPVNTQNVIEQNLIYNNGGGVGYGLYLDYDSVIVRNNIFCKNNIAVFCDSKGDNCLITNNSYYKNEDAFIIGTNSKGNKYLNNTFSLNEGSLFSFKEINDIEIESSNMLHNYGRKNIFVNNTSSDLSIIQNYWGTTDTAQINNFIYDSLDNPALGKLEYIPFLYSMDTSNPVSPPYNVIKQVVDSKVQISWYANNEQDLMGYRIYYGDYANYSFSESYEVGTDTAFVFPVNISINDSIAVTAFDSAINQNNNQFSGHESPFAFAALYPYAGGDTIICQNIHEFEIENSTIPFNYQSLFWTTSGDGIFNNLHNIAPSYFPGAIDIQNGGATILFNVVTIDSDTLIDSFNLTIIDDPEVTAGNDTTIIADAEIALVEASAQNYDSIMWVTSGDGSFNSNTLVNPVYSPGTSDTELGIVLLEIKAYSRCGMVTDSVFVFIEPYYFVEGKLWSSQKDVNPGVVIAFKQSDVGARAVQIKSTESDGAFRFEKLMEGSYYIYAIPDTNNFDNAAPFYYANDLRWQDAYLLKVDADVYDVDIHLQVTDFVLPVGEGSISGHMELPPESKFSSDIYCMPWFENSNGDFCSDGLSNITVLLFNNSKAKLLDYTLTNALGNFYFNQLPYGEYVVDAEKAGLLTIPSTVITLSPEHKNETGVVLQISQQKITVFLNPLAPDEVFSSVFPNPASSEINIPYLNPLLISSQIVVYDIFGNRVLSNKITTEKTSSSINISIIKLTSGLYFGQIINSSQTIHFRFVKK